MMRELACRLSAEEVDQRKDELARLLDEQDAEEARFAVLKGEHKAKVDALESRVDTVRGQIRTKTETRPVACCEQRDERRSQIDVRREDTFEVIESRAMTLAERQGDLPFEGAEEPEPDAQVDLPLEPVEPGPTEQKLVELDKKMRKRKGNDVAPDEPPPATEGGV